MPFKCLMLCCLVGLVACTSTAEPTTSAPQASDATAPVLPAPPWEDLRSATAEQVRDWLQVDAQGRLYMSQHRQLIGRLWTKAELVTIFGQPTSYTDQHMHWLPFRSKPNTGNRHGGKFVEDQADQHWPLGTAFTFGATAAPESMAPRGATEPYYAIMIDNPPPQRPRPGSYPGQRP
jgi:hypothetical protein